jgi:hypothetical protein
MHDLSRGCSVEDMIDVTLVANKMAATKGVSMRNELKKAVSGLIGVNPYAVDKQYAAKCAVPSFKVVRPIYGDDANGSSWHDRNERSRGSD